METHIIGFTGNRIGLTEEQKTGIRLILDKFTNIVVSHGDCLGADTDMHTLCVDYREANPHKTIKIHIYPPDIASHRGFNVGDVMMEAKPYLKRNDMIVRASNVLIACPMDKNVEILRSGTWSTVRRARKLGKTVYLL
jgi:hypothetical protein